MQSRNYPETVHIGLKETDFGDWIWSDHKERIEAMGITGNIYRLQVTNRKDIYKIHLNEFGEVIQVKYN